MTHSHRWPDAQWYSMTDFGENKWNLLVKPYLPFDLKEKVFLELGCNAGLFLVMALRAGAEFVYGVLQESRHLFGV